MSFRLCVVLLALPMAVAFFATPAAAEEQHVVPLPVLNEQAARATSIRESQIGKIETLLSRKPVRQALRTVKLPKHKVVEAARLLDDAELAAFAARAERLDRDIRGGALTNEQLTYIVIALATAVIVLIAV